MDMLPIRPTKTDLIRPTISTANDGGSKSQSGYINVRDEGGDRIELSDEMKRLMGEENIEAVEENSSWEAIKQFLSSIINAILKFFGIKQ